MRFTRTRHDGLWVFDDEAVGLRQEPFVSGADAILDRLTAEIPGAAAVFTRLFSTQLFPGVHLVLSESGSGRSSNGTATSARSSG